MLELFRMNIQITGGNLDITSEIKELVHSKVGEKLEKLLTHFSSDMKTAYIKIEKSKLKHFDVNFDMQLPGKEHIFAKTRHINLESALIDLEQLVERQLKKYRDDLVNYSLG